MTTHRARSTQLAKILARTLALAAIALALWVVMRGGGSSTTPAFFDKSLTLDSALERATADGRPVLAFFTADWCPPCQALKREALADESVAAAAAQQTIPVYVDMTDVRSDRGAAALAQKYAVNAFPTLLMLRGEEQLGRIVGGASAPDLKRWIEQTSKK